MQKSTKAALLSGLIFPGVGHLVLKRYLRGSVLMLLALVAFSYFVNVAYQSATVIVDRINSGDIPLDTGAIAAAASDAGAGASGPVENFSLAALFVCWLFGIIDSYRLGATQDKQVHE